ncbi:hypothetical protein EJ06DRAFT_558599 [Trichodelitschia bisporula]|uniref:Beta/gamma crystallin 'Greek key' domain-containing protein n=1 Tax=Trichodelitschia bisporula TaxID=703511 RepID=A0A6G1HQF1_9PEZI|nr:hypothetical protein EJ06DRAFT_558599 [Trichodelitschia bisporula]
MHFSTILLAALTSTSTIAAPAPAPAPNTLSARATPLIDLWQDSGFLGLKFTGKSNVGTCENLAGSGFNNNVSSGKAKPGFRCTIWVNKDCDGTGFSFNANPGSNQFPSWIDNKSSSWKCVAA